MVAHSLKQRISDFLIKYPPFSYIPESEVLKIAATSKVKVLNPNEFIFHEGENPVSEFYVIYQGSVELIDEKTNEIIEILEEGDIFGIAALLAKRLYIFSARTVEDTILYILPFDFFKEYIQKYPRVLRYFSSGFAPGMHQFKKKKIDLEEDFKSFFAHDEVLEIKITKNVITAKPDMTVQQIAEIMSEKNIGSIIIVNDNYFPVGIVTDSDLRKKIATGKYPVTVYVKEIMSSPVITFSKNISATDVIIEMMKRKIRHLCLTEDGTPNSKIVGIVSEHDVLALHGNNPAVIVKEIQKTDEIIRLSQMRNRANQLLKEYLKQDVSIVFIANTITEINDALISRAIHLSIEKINKEGYQNPELKFAWLSLGSEGRKEQLLRTDQDNAIVYEDPPEEKKEYAQKYFLKLAADVNQILIQCGFEECPGEIMAKNPRWCQPVSVWKSYFKKWMDIPDGEGILNTTIFFDFRVTYGEEKLASELRDYIIQNKNNFFILFLAKKAIDNPPPINFFRNLIVEKSGEHKNEFDLKTRCLMPLIDAARVLVLDKNYLEYQSTIERYEALRRLDNRNESIYKEAIESFEIYLKLRTQQGLFNNNSGRYIKPEELTKLEKQILRNTFHSIELIQNLLNSNYQLNLVR